MHHAPHAILRMLLTDIAIHLSLSPSFLKLSQKSTKEKQFFHVNFSNENHDSNLPSQFYDLELWWVAISRRWPSISWTWLHIPYYGLTPSNIAFENNSSSHLHSMQLKNYCPFYIHKITENEACLIIINWRYEHFLVASRVQFAVPTPIEHATGGRFTWRQTWWARAYDYRARQARRTTKSADPSTGTLDCVTLPHACKHPVLIRRNVTVSYLISCSYISKKSSVGDSNDRNDHTSSCL